LPLVTLPLVLVTAGALVAVGRPAQRRRNRVTRDRELPSITDIIPAHMKPTSTRMKVTAAAAP
jgi:hypothetical protein